ncbi:hypothetical protein K5R88_16700 [Pseudomonas sp. MM213]|uniref:hypothetical protein n=1 Tax=Pseudomonas sp. MM213 TaxID=2866807 RepID=UPI001CF56D89|nr:hypothetical protein [Pseudomonas sp. MM213]UCP13113.1 hypothetical protein K5R88_16700 [Pseudomonas sp. MM213]
MGGILVGVLAAVRCAHQIQDLIIVVLPVCPVQAQSTPDFFTITSENLKIGMTGLTSEAGCVGAGLLAMAPERSLQGSRTSTPASHLPQIAGEKKPAITGRFFLTTV